MILIVTRIEDARNEKPKKLLSVSVLTLYVLVVCADMYVKA